jgi:hypothetical protein
MLSIPSTASFTVSGQLHCMLHTPADRSTWAGPAQIITTAGLLSPLLLSLSHPDQIRAGWGRGRAPMQSGRSRAPRRAAAWGRRGVRTSQQTATPRTWRARAARRAQPRGSDEAREDLGEPRPQGSGRPSVERPPRRVVAPGKW